VLFGPIQFFGAPQKFANHATETLPLSSSSGLAERMPERHSILIARQSSPHDVDSILLRRLIAKDKFKIDGRAEAQLKLETSGDTESESFHSSFSFGEKAIASSGLKTSTRPTHPSSYL
jgi:hypothetical protein